MKKFASALVVLLAVFLVGAFGYSTYKAETPSTTFGAVVGPDQVGSDHYSQNGVVVYPTHVRMNAASTTLCSVKSPNATTTIKSFVANFTTATASARTIYLAKGATAQATTTNLETVSIGANALGTVIASTTGRTNGLPIVPPKTYLVVGSSLGFSTTSPLGYCTVELEGV